MKRVHQEQGERDWAYEDLRELQSEPLRAVDSIFSSFGDCVISGCNVVGNTISSGMVSIGGRVMPFEGATNVTFPCKLVASVEEIIGKYVDNGDKPIARNYKAVVAVDGDGIEITMSGAASVLRRGSDAVDSDSSATFATSKAVQAVNKKVTDLAGKDLLKSDRIDLEDSKTLATSMAVATVNKEIKPLKQATDMELGGVKAKARTNETLEIAIDTESGKLFAPLVDEIPVNTILTTTSEAGNIFGEKFLKCDGSKVDFSDYPLLKIAVNAGERILSSYTDGNGGHTPTGYECLNGNYIIISTYNSNNKGQIHFSTNLSYWQRVELGTTSSSIHGIIFVNGKYYSYGSTWAGIKSSTDLRTWSSVSLGSNSFVATKMHYANGVIIVLNVHTISHTIDFSTKTDIVLPDDLSSEKWISVNYCNGLWMVGSVSGVVITSSNLIDWTQCDLVFNNSDKEIKDFCYFNSQWIVSSNSGIAISKNGVTDWMIIDVKIRGSYNAEGQFNIVDNILFLRAGSTGLFSENGVDWHPILVYYQNFFQNFAVDRSLKNSTDWDIFKTDISRSTFKKTLPNIANSYIKSLK